MNQRRKKKGQVPPIASTSGCPESHHGHGPHASPARLPHAALRRTIRRQGDEVLRRKISRARNPQHSEKSQRPRPRGYSHHRRIREVSEERLTPLSGRRSREKLALSTGILACCETQHSANRTVDKMVLKCPMDSVVPV